MVFACSIGDDPASLDTVPFNIMDIPFGPATSEEITISDDEPVMPAGAALHGGFSTAELNIIEPILQSEDGDSQRTPKVDPVEQAAVEKAVTDSLGNDGSEKAETNEASGDIEVIIPQASDDEDDDNDDSFDVANYKAPKLTNRLSCQVGSSKNMVLIKPYSPL